MDLCPQPEPTELDPDLQFPADAYYHLIHTLRGVIPPVSDAPADLTRRDNAVIAQVACLLPANADEANIAATYVAAQARAMESMRLGRVYPGDPNFVLKCNVRAAGMMREARATRSLLLRVQAERRKREADGDAEGKAAWIEHCAIGLMRQAITAGLDPAITDAPPATAEPAAGPTGGPDPAVAAEADRYALSHRKRAALIRSLGRLPDRLDCGPLPPELVGAIVTGTSPILRSLDPKAGAAPAVAI